LIFENRESARIRGFFVLFCAFLPELPILPVVAAVPVVPGTAAPA